MIRLLTRALLGSCLLASAVAMSQDPQTQSPEPATSGARQVILIIGDGMGEQQVTIARNYLKGARGRLLLDQLPLRSTAQILTIQDRVEGKPVYVADSANTATSMATGVVTSRGRISTQAGNDKDVRTIVEIASAQGYRTGIVSTASVTDATPAAFAAHISLRLCENPTAMVDFDYKGIAISGCAQDLKSRGGSGSISEQLASSELDVILGGGSKHFSPLIEDDSVSVSTLASENGFLLLSNASELAAAPPGRRLLGLFSPSTMPVRLQGTDGRSAESPQPSMMNYVHRYLGDVTLPAVMSCEPNPGYAGVPSLKQMTDVALAQLSHENDRGFFLMIESASIDKQSHERKPCGSIGEVEQLEEALASALAFAATHPQTLVLVTADHSHAAQLVPYESLFAVFPVPIYTPGKLARIITPEGSHMAINYATNNFAVEEHTGASVPLYANSQGIGRVPPFVQQPEIFNITLEYLGL